MSTLPLLLSLAEELGHLGVTPPSWKHSPFYASVDEYRRCCDNEHQYRYPTHRLPIAAAAGGSRILRDHRRLGVDSLIPHSTDTDGFQVCMDVQQFKPSELTVKVIDDSVVVEGKHEEREDEHGFITRHFLRRYVLPHGYHADHVESTLSSDGVLTVRVPSPRKADANARVVQIQQTGPAHLNVKSGRQKSSADAVDEAIDSHRNGDGEKDKVDK